MSCARPTGTAARSPLDLGILQRLTTPAG